MWTDFYDARLESTWLTTSVWSFHVTPRKRWQAVLAGKTPDRVPCDFWSTGEVKSRLKRELGCATDRALWERLDVDKCVHLAPLHPLATEEDWHIQSVFPIWRVGTREVAYQDGLGTYTETIEHPLAKAETAADVERFAWPEPREWDVATFRARCEIWRDYPIVGMTYEPFYLYCHLRGMEQALEDLIVNPQIADAALERIFEIHAAIIRGALTAAGDLITLVYVAEDLGTQESLLMSPASFRRFLKPRMKRMIELVHSFGVKVIHHDDGAIRPLLPELIEIGIDVLNPVQWRCHGMERAGLARDFGRSLVFHGAVDNQQTLPFGTPDDVRREVADNIRIFRDCKGYVVAPCHNMQPNTPTANILALYEAVHEFGRS
jgi:uroporphyrinogen decarboxylase